MQPVLLDASVIVALLDRRDRRHGACAEYFRGPRRPLVTCEAVISESCFLLASNPAAQVSILQNVVEGIFQLPCVFSRSAAQVLAVLRKYSDIPASFADACLIHMANELDTGDILTLDSDFKRYRWRRNRAFNLLIPLD
jgi:predicted nucleic acid-binding protein